MQNVIQNLRNELIRSISAIDAWFDKDRTLLSQKITSTETVAEFLHNLVLTSRNLLDAITQKTSRHAGPVDVQFPKDTLVSAFSDGMGRLNLSKTRAELREQLDRCLIYLEWLQQRQGRGKSEIGEEDVQQLGGYQGIYLLLIHLKRYVGDLNQLANRSQSHLER